MDENINKGSFMKFFLLLIMFCTSIAFAQETEVVQKLDWQELLVNLPELIVGLCGALIAIFLFIPGEQPEKFLKGVVEFISKFSKK
jgi:hypothetical protein